MRSGDTESTHGGEDQGSSCVEDIDFDDGAVYVVIPTVQVLHCGLVGLQECLSQDSTLPDSAGTQDHQPVPLLIVGHLCESVNRGQRGAVGYLLPYRCEHRTVWMIKGAVDYSVSLSHRC